MECGHLENFLRVDERYVTEGMRPLGNFLCDGTGRGGMPQVECDHPVAHGNEMGNCSASNSVSLVFPCSSPALLVSPDLHAL